VYMPSLVPECLIGRFGECEPDKQGQTEIARRSPGRKAEAVPEGERLNLVQ
jgi:hypothetical protein